MQRQPIYRALTDQGRRRERNEDSVDAGPVRVEAGAGRPWHLLVVADGVGGHQRGDWASQLAVATLREEIGERLSGTDPGEALRQAFQATNETLWRQTSGDPARDRAATTLVGALVDGDQLWWANVGDSRAYLVRQGEAIRLTEDHSWVEEQVRLGLLTPEQAATSPNRNVITRGIGFESEVEVDVGQPIALRHGDVLVLCSDGLHGQVKDAEIAETVESLAPDRAAERLVALSNERGGPDNISVIVCVFAEAILAPETGSVQSTAGSVARAARAPVTGPANPPAETAAAVADDTSPKDWDQPASAFGATSALPPRPPTRPSPADDPAAPTASTLPASTPEASASAASKSTAGAPPPRPAGPASAPPLAGWAPTDPAPSVRRSVIGRQRPGDEPPWLRMALITLPIAMVVALIVVIVIQLGLIPMGRS